MPEIGIVKWFDPRDFKRKGILQLESGEEIVFYHSDSHFVVEGEKSPRFAGYGKIMVCGKERRLRDPKKGEWVVFRRTIDQYGLRASPWSFYDQWVLCSEWIEDYKQETALKNVGEVVLV